MLTYSDENAGVAFSVTPLRYDATHQIWRWSISEYRGEEIASGEDLRTPGEWTRHAEALGTLFTYLSAWAESIANAEQGRDEHENADLFPYSLRGLLRHYSADAFDALRDECVADEEEGALTVTLSEPDVTLWLPED